MAVSDVAALAEELVRIPSASGEEGAVMDHVAGLLGRAGWSVRRQEVSAGRANVWATRAGGGVTLSTHLDTVAPHVPPERRDGRLYGRGACDAKGIAAAMIAAAGELVAGGEDRVDLLFVVGEEAGSDGARAARDLPATSRWLVNGEPTEGRLASAAKGSLRVEVATEGRAAHSAYPELGVSAIGAMVELLAGLEGLDWPSDPVLGETTANVGVVRGGVAANVVPPACEAEILVRLVGDDGPVRELLNAWTRGRATVEYGTCIAPQRFHTLPGFETGPVSYTSDARVLEGWGTPLLFGPGSIHVAHRPDEHVEIAELEAAVGTYAEIVRRLLEG